MPSIADSACLSVSHCMTRCGTSYLLFGISTELPWFTKPANWTGPLGSLSARISVWVTFLEHVLTDGNKLAHLYKYSRVIRPQLGGIDLMFGGVRCDSRVTRPTHRVASLSRGNACSRRNVKYPSKCSQVSSWIGGVSLAGGQRVVSLRHVLIRLSSNFLVAAMTYNG